MYLITVTISAWILGCLLLQTPLDLKSKRPVKNVYKNWLDSDRPISPGDEDLLERGRFLDQFAEIINKYEETDSFVFGLLGKWGEGKTSILNFLEGKLKKDSIVIRFDPWYFNNQDKLLEKFFELIYKKINESYFYPNLTKHFKRYQKVLAFALRKYGFDLEAIAGDSDIEETKEKLNEAVQSLNKKIVIFIDDIDRLEGCEIAFVLKLIKLCGNFHKFLYIVAFDKDAVIDALKAINIQPNFIHKIIQLEIELPKIEQIRLDQIFKGTLVSLFDAMNILQTDNESEIFLRTFRLEYRNQIRKLMVSVREIKRFFNTLKLKLPLVKDEVNYSDFIILEIVRIYFPGVYEDIYKNREYYYFSEWNKEVSPWFGKEKDRQETINKHLDNVLPTDERKSIIVNLLAALFPLIGNYTNRNLLQFGNNREFEKGRRIAHPAYFERYFLLNVPIMEISDAYMNILLQDLNSETPSRVKEILVNEYKKFKSEKKLIDFLDKLILYKTEINSAIYEAIIESIYENTSLFSSQPRTLFDSETDLAMSLVSIMANHFSDTPEIQRILIKVIKEAETDFFASFMINYLTPETNKIISNWTHIGNPELNQVLSERLQGRYIKENKNVFEEDYDHSGFILNRWAVCSEDDKNKVNHYLLSLFENQPIYIGKFIVRYQTIIVGFLYEDLKHLIDIDKFYELVSKHKNNAFSNANEEFAIEKFIDNYQKEKPKNNKKAEAS
jgi:hypothetical protein